jgi:SAM-dependent methyltransferase
MSYDLVSDEYGDETAHPTSHALGDASRQLILSQISAFSKPGPVIEIGPGFSSATPDHLMSHTVYIDNSKKMLQVALSRRGSRGLFASAAAIPIGSGKIDLIVACLGDPYNTPRFWSEVSRILADSGQCVFSSPSSEWASAFRRFENSPPDRSRFTLRDGSSVDLPSFVLDVRQQANLLATHGLVITEFKVLKRAEAPLAPKLEAVNAGVPVIYSFLIEKQR